MLIRELVGHDDVIITDLFCPICRHSNQPQHVRLWHHQDEGRNFLLPAYKSGHDWDFFQAGAMFRLEMISDQLQAVRFTLEYEKLDEAEERHERSLMPDFEFRLGSIVWICPPCDGRYGDDPQAILDALMMLMKDE